MGGERASKTRQRESGRICCLCGTLLDAPPWPGERYCNRCAYNRPRHRVLLTLMLRSGWHISFLEADCKTPVGRPLTFRDPESIRKLAQRGGAELSLNGHEWTSMLENGRGSLWLNLTAEQYRKLRR